MKWRRGRGPMFSLAHWACTHIGNRNAAAWHPAKPLGGLSAERVVPDSSGNEADCPRGLKTGWRGNTGAQDAREVGRSSRRHRLVPAYATGVLCLDDPSLSAFSSARARSRKSQPDEKPETSRGSKGRADCWGVALQGGSGGARLSRRLLKWSVCQARVVGKPCCTAQGRELCIGGLALFHTGVSV